MQEAYDYETAHYSPDDAAFLKDLHGVLYATFPDYQAYQSPFPQTYVNEAHAVCALPKGATQGALDDVIRVTDPDLVGSVYRVALEHPGVITADEKFITVAVQHFCPDRANETFWTGAKTPSG